MENICPIHNVEMQKRQNKSTGEFFFSHKGEDGWCHGRAKKSYGKPSNELKSDALAVIIQKLDKIDKRFDGLAEFLKNKSDLEL